MQCSIFLCLSQARINWQGCDKKGIRHKMGELVEVDCWLVRTEWCPPRLSVCLPLVILPSTMMSRRSFLLAPAHPGRPRRRAVKWLWWCGGTSCFSGPHVLPVIQPTVSKHWRKHNALIQTTGLASSILHPPQDFLYQYQHLYIYSTSTYYHYHKFIIIKHEPQFLLCFLLVRQH